ncbi:hypothetical protein yinte0001_29310 [Yersinia intermedia ATCC 29909]|nr:hypothetical protein yinte0001_29310 [Yersinia intermedia ATCC 29909]
MIRVIECSQRTCSLKYDGYKLIILLVYLNFIQPLAAGLVVL